MKKYLQWILGAVALLPGAAFAGEDFGSIALRASSVSGDGQADLFGVGASLRLKLTDHWGVEGAAEFLDDGGLQSSIPLSASVVRYFLPRLPLSPYVLAGAGLRFDGAGVDRSRRFGNAGLGLSLKLRSLILSGDVRYLLLDHVEGESLADGFVPGTARAGQGSLALGYAF